MRKNNNKPSGQIMILVSPWEKGFTCGILSDGTTLGMNSKDYELCSTIAKGMCFAANQNPDKIFKLGLEASRLKKIKKILIICHYLKKIIPMWSIFYNTSEIKKSEKTIK